MRSKEEAHDYRYFPEPDLVPLAITDDWLKTIQADMVELPADRRDRFVNVYGLREYDAAVLTQTRELSDYFERARQGVQRSQGGRQLGDGRPRRHAQGGGQGITESPVSAENLGELVTPDRQGRAVRQAGEGDLPEDVLHR